MIFSDVMSFQFGEGGIGGVSPSKGAASTKQEIGELTNI